MGPGGAGGDVEQGPGGQKKMQMAAPDCIFWSAAIAVLLAGLVGFLTELFGGSLFDLVDEIYLLFFGSIMFVLDNPMNFQGLVMVQKVIFKYCKFLEMFTGRGIWYMFLGCMVFLTLWEPGEDHSNWAFGGFVLGLYVFGVGAFAAALGITKSKKLEKVRIDIKDKQADVRALYTHYAKSNPREGLTPAEFDVLVMQVSGVQFPPQEVDFVYNAIATGRSGALLTPQDMDEWVNSNPPPLIGACIPATLL
jgi:hypothetical protein